MNYHLILTAGEGVPTRVFAGHFETIEAAERQIARIEACVHHYKGHIEMAAPTTQEIENEVLTIDEEFQSLIRHLGREEFQALQASILADGCRDPIVTWGGIIVDGHHRYEICQKWDLDFTTVEMDFPDRNSAKLWMIENQMGRRNLSDIDRIDLARKREEILKPLAKANQGTRTDLSAILPKGSPIDTRKESARFAGVGERTYDAGKFILEAAENGEIPPEELEAVRCGDKKINPTAKGIRESRVPHVSQATGENEWYTPPEIIDRARRAMGEIDLDPASCEIAQKQIRAGRFFTLADDGLSQAWAGRVWLNPPYSRDLVSRFTKKLLAEYRDGRVSQACVLVNNATETNWFQELQRARAAKCLVDGRIAFLNRECQPVNKPLQGQIIIYLGNRRRHFYEAFKDLGGIDLSYEVVMEWFNEPGE